MAVAGLRGTGDFGTDERPKDFRETILWLNPNGAAPIFGLTSKAKKRTTTNPEFSWWNEPTGHIRLSASGATLGAGDQLFTVDSTDPDSADLTKQWGAADNLQVGDVLQVEVAQASDTASYAAELIEVTGVLSATQFTANRGVAGTTAGSVASGTKLTLMGSAFSEGSGISKAVSRNPIKFFNYTQIFKNTYELTGTVDQTKTRTGEPWSNDKKRKTFDHARNIEMSFLYGRRFETTGSNGKPKRYMGGLRSLIPTTRSTIFTSPPTTNTFLDAVYKVFDYDTGAGDTRLMFCGNVALNSFNKMIRADTANTIYFEGLAQVYGMNFREFVLPQGRLMIKSHPLLNIHPEFSKTMWILDFDAIKYVSMKGRDTKAFNDVQLKEEDVRRGFYQTECSLELDYGGLTCAYLGNFII